MPAIEPRSSAMKERLLVQTNTPATLGVSSLTRVVNTATVTTALAHGYATGDFVTHAGAGQAAYNVKAKVTVTGATIYTFTVVGTPATPATGTITAVYASDAQGAMKFVWRTMVTVPAELIPIRASERLQMAAMQAVVDYRFRIRVRVDLSPKMRVVWTPSWSPSAVQQTLEIAGLEPWGDGRTWMLLNCSGVVA